MSLKKSYFGILVGHIIIMGGCLIHGSKIGVFLHFIFILIILFNYQSLLNNLYSNPLGSQIFDIKFPINEESEKKWVEFYEHPVKRELEFRGTQNEEEEFENLL